ncbi:MAG TPA: hypothetical protein VHI98_12160 [Vicinamibacterales bacterium]|jgi:hypothetical protein|nr:hypothetical protein [Vicinamibacterales bacterium]
MLPKRSQQAPPSHHCPACNQPQTKIQRRLGETTRGSTIYVCARKGECSVGVDLAKIEGWVAV